MNFDEAVNLSLKTWYPKDHELHMNSHHPLGKLLGEWGELLDDYMKSIYKPGYVFEPEDELGDIWYYVRILCYQEGHKPVLGNTDLDIQYDKLFSLTIIELSIAFFSVCLKESYADYCSTLNIVYTALFLFAREYNLTLDDLTHSNWEKLKPGSERGDEWMKARIQTDYANRGKIGLK
jgi:hypothetical protein